LPLYFGCKAKGDLQVAILRWKVIGMFKLLILAHSQYQLDNTIKMSNYFTKRTKCGSEYAETMEEEPHYTKAYSVPIKYICS
jgi:hypothetical protein